MFFSPSAREASRACFWRSIDALAFRARSLYDFILAADLSVLSLAEADVPREAISAAVSAALAKDHGPA
jgi:hypothetical protein